jgi:hypothetical protein
MSGIHYTEISNVSEACQQYRCKNDMVTELPVIRDQTDAERAVGSMCQGCDYWTRYRHSYAYGICTLGGYSIPPRWSLEINICDGFKKE